ncbi:MAG: hypothetical protein H0V40_00325 [Actinobacteria bacterium]|nr:hypothetical protein [Actinomycetota bacterium]
MDEHEQAARSDDSAEGGVLDDENEGSRQPAEPAEDPAEGGALESEQQGKGYGADEGERYDALPPQ